MPTIHLVIPFLDETSTLRTIVDRVFEVTWPEGWDVSVILVDDGSHEEAQIESRRIGDSRASVTLVRHEHNRGKGAALRTAFAIALDTAVDADLVGIQDADLEYAPDDLRRFIEVFEAEGDDVDAIFGNRWANEVKTPISWIHRLGNRTLTELSNLATGLRLTDMECCFKVFRTPLLRKMLPELSESRFAIEPQLAAAVARHHGSIAEVDITYAPRSFAEGKKIGLGDLISAVTTIVREWRRTRRTSRGGRS